MRVRGFTQDDGHIFCTEDQILPRMCGLHALLQKVYRDFGFTDIIYKVATRPETHRLRRELGQGRARPDGEPARSGVRVRDLAGRRAPFYGPKIEYTLKDAIGRQWQCGTMQVDFSNARAAGRGVRGEDGGAPPPVMLHRAIVGSLERFIGILIEQHAGALPAWLAPVQVAVLNITDAQADYARDCRQNAAKSRA
jgi:threonyl-tRNA synthetase